MYINEVLWQLYCDNKDILFKNIFFIMLLSVNINYLRFVNFHLFYCLNPFLLIE